MKDAAFFHCALFISQQQQKQLLLVISRIFPVLLSGKYHTNLHDFGLILTRKFRASFWTRICPGWTSITRIRRIGEWSKFEMNNFVHKLSDQIRVRVIPVQSGQTPAKISLKWAQNQQCGKSRDIEVRSFSIYKESARMEK